MRSTARRRACRPRSAVPLRCLFDCRSARLLLRGPYPRRLREARRAPARQLGHGAAAGADLAQGRRRPNAGKPIAPGMDVRSRLASSGAAAASGSASLCASVTWDGNRPAGTPASGRRVCILPARPEPDANPGGAGRRCAMTRRVLRLKQVQAQTGLSRSTIFALQQRGILPAVDQDRTQGDRVVRGRGAELHRDPSAHRRRPGRGELLTGGFYGLHPAGPSGNGAPSVAAC